MTMPKLVAWDLGDKPTGDSLRQCAELVLAGLASHGSALVRGAIGLEGFIALAEELPAEYNSHWGVFSGFRSAINNDPKTMTVSEGQGEVVWHKERAWLPFPPSALLFHCRKPPVPGGGGQTGVVDGTQLYQALSPRVRDYIEATPVVFKMELRLEDDQIRRAFLQNISCETFDEADGMLRTVSDGLPNGETLAYEVSRERFAYSYSVSLVRPMNGEKGVGGYIAGIESGGARYTPTGDPFPATIIDELQSAATSVAYMHDWVKGDILVIDNSRCMHCRTAFVDPQRDIVLRMGWWKDAGPPTKRLRSLFGGSAILA